MARLITGGEQMFDALAFEPPDEETYAYMRSKSDHYRNRITERGRLFMDRVQETYRSIERSDVVRLARSVGRKLTNLWQQNDIRKLTDIADFQHAPENMNRWLMASPAVRRRYHRGECVGYGEDYVDHDPGLRGENHYDWRRVMNGIFVHDEERGVSVASTYYEPIHNKGDLLDVVEQDDILTSWDILKDLMHGTEDPTCKRNSKL